MEAEDLQYLILICPRGQWRFEKLFNWSVDRQWAPCNPTPGGTICTDYGGGERQGTLMQCASFASFCTQLESYGSKGMQGFLWRKETICISLSACSRAGEGEDGQSWLRVQLELLVSLGSVGFLHQVM